MGKLISAYAGFTATDLKNRGSNTCDMVVNGTNVDCTNLTDTRIKNVLGVGVTGVAQLCTSTAVNKWSCFSPTEWYVGTYPNLVNRVKTPYTMGSFAGYNHNAVEPTSFNSSFEYTKGAAGSTITQSIAAKVKMGEYDWSKLGGTHARVVTFDGASIYSQSGILPINGAGNFITFDNVTFTFSTSTVGTTNYVTKTYICASDGSEIAELPIYGNITCTIIAATAYILTVKVSGSVKSFTMIGDADHSNGNYITRTGKYTGTGTVANKTLTNIVYDLLNKTTNAVESTLTVTSFNSYEYPTMLSDMYINDTEAFSAGGQRLIPSASQYLRISMNYA